MNKKTRACRICGCTDDDCRQCLAKTGEPCYWVEDDLCGACILEANKKALESLKTFSDSFRKIFFKN